MFVRNVTFLARIVEGLSVLPNDTMIGHEKASRKRCFRACNYETQLSTTQGKGKMARRSSSAVAPAREAARI